MPGPRKAQAASGIRLTCHWFDITGARGLDGFRAFRHSMCVHRGFDAPQAIVSLRCPDTPVLEATVRPKSTCKVDAQLHINSCLLHVCGPLAQTPCIFTRSGTFRNYHLQDCSDADRDPDFERCGKKCDAAKEPGRQLAEQQAPEFRTQPRLLRKPAL